MLLKIAKVLAFLFLILLLFAAYHYKKIQRLLHVNSLFDEKNIVDNFMNMEKSFPFHHIEKSKVPYAMPSNLGYTLPSSFSYQEQNFQVQDYLNYSNTTGLMLLHRDTIIYESYHLGMQKNTTHISWSVAKSFVSTLVGIALEEGLFESIQDPITKYLPQFKDTGYDGVKIKDILQMSSGVGFNEDYRDFNSDINRFGRHFALGKSFESFALSLKNEKPPGTYNHYVSLDTQVLGMLLRKVTGKTLAAYLKEKIWDPMGMEYDAQWVIDQDDVEMALGGLNVSLRDYAKLGLLYLREGQWEGQQIVPKTWVKQAVTPTEPHLMPGATTLSNSHFGYGFQWWIPQNWQGDYFAAGIYNQYIYVNPSKDLVIVKTSANHHFKEIGDESKDIHVALLQAIAQGFPDKKVEAMPAEKVEE
ncbi:MAG: serine hydrolase domain-containing protein [Saprospiraceae bacterium]